MDSFQLYKDMKARTNGEIYLGVVGPVRTGKSTFIKRFMDLLVLPNMVDEHARNRTTDELPQSASGTTIMTTEPKFVPKEAAVIRLSEDVEVKIRLIDCVGFVTEGATEFMENDAERQVKTPWFEQEIPFTKAAAIGTQKVIRDHATIGIVVTTDYTIDFKLDDGTMYDQQTLAEGTPITIPAAPSKEGHTFLGWFDAQTGGNSIGDTPVADGDATWYAHFEANDLTVNYVDEKDQSAPTGITVKYGEPYTVLAPADNTKFICWAADDG